MRTAVAAASLALLAASCATQPTPTPGPRPTPTPSAPTAAPAMRLEPVSFAALPGWAGSDGTAALYALQRQCRAWSSRSPDAPLSSSADYGGNVGDWLGVCGQVWSVAPEDARAFFEANFTPNRVIASGGQAKLTAYYEPAIEARRTPEPGFSEPLLARPDDLVSVDVAAFAERLGGDALKGAPRRLTGQVDGNVVRPYPDRAAIARAPNRAIAWAHPADVYNLQVQGSGRLVFPDGTQTRAAYAAQNGFSWKSVIGTLRQEGRLPNGGGWAGLKAYFDANPGAARPALDTDPSYVFFNEEPIEDPGAGPKGAAGVPLTPGGSLAVDPAFHPYGAVLYVDAPGAGGFPRLLVAQDTGGAIRRGPLRGDVFMGTGADAGAAAERMNIDAPAFFTLLPKAVLTAQSGPRPQS